MEIYDECGLCGNYADLVNWRNTVQVCADCAYVLDTRVRKIQSSLKCGNEEAFWIIRRTFNPDSVKESK